jgi:hypothetical protein
MAKPLFRLVHRALPFQLDEKIENRQLPASSLPAMVSPLFVLHESAEYFQS